MVGCAAICMPGTYIESEALEWPRFQALSESERVGFNLEDLRL